MNGAQEFRLQLDEEIGKIKLMQGINALKERESIDRIASFLAFFINQTPLQIVIQTEDVKEAVKKVFDGLSIIARKAAMEHILRSFAHKGCLMGVQAVLALGVDIECRYIDKLPVTDLSMADIVKGMGELITDLFSPRKRKPPSWQNSWHNCSPLQLAAEEGHAGIVKCLVERGADVHRKTNNDNTAFALASKRPRTEPQQEICRILEDRMSIVPRP